MSPDAIGDSPAQPREGGLRFANPPYELLRFPRKRNLMQQPRQNNPAGKSPKSCPALARKIFRLTCRANPWF